MTQFNLLPDIKLEYLSAERMRRLVISISVMVGIVAILLAGTLLTITIVQGQQINNLSSSIKRQGSIIMGHTNLNDILTIQNQIATLTTLHQKEPAITSLAGYLNQLIPVNANISSLSIDLNADTMTISGSANSLATINQLVDSFKFATYQAAGNNSTKQAFSQVVLSSFGIGPNSIDTYTVNCNFDPTLFNNVDKVTLYVPNQVTTRSMIDQPTALFKLTPTTGGSVK